MSPSAEEALIVGVILIITKEMTKGIRKEINRRLKARKKAYRTNKKKR